MKDWHTLLAAPRFRAYWLALLCDNLGSWCVIASLPILVAERFGAGMVLVLSMGLRIVPKVLLAPLAGGPLRRFGSARVASTAMLVMAVLTGLLPWCENLILLQVLIGGIGTLDLFIMPGLLSLRGAVTPPVLLMAGNTMCAAADRTAKVAGPALGGVMATAGFGSAFAVFALMIAASAILVIRLRVPPAETPATRAQSGGVQSFEVAPVADITRPCQQEKPEPDRFNHKQSSSSMTSFLHMIRTDQQIAGLLVASVTYMVMLGGLRPFLFWANRDWFRASDTAWTALLVAQGAGALVGAIISTLFVARMLRGMTVYTLTLLTGIMEGAIHLLLLFARNSTQAIVILALAGVPEIISTAAWFTAMQACLAPAQQARFFTFVAPIWDLFFALGIASAGLHAQGLLSLSGYWALVSLIATLPPVPLLRSSRQEALARRSTPPTTYGDSQ